jgi:hypothetical protein
MWNYCGLMQLDSINYEWSKIIKNRRKQICVIKVVSGRSKLNDNGGYRNQMNVCELCVIDVCWCIL